MKVYYTRFLLFCLGCYIEIGAAGWEIFHIALLCECESTVRPSDNSWANDVAIPYIDLKITVRSYTLGSYKLCILRAERLQLQQFNCQSCQI